MILGRIKISCLVVSGYLSLSFASPPPRGAAVCTGNCNYVEHGGLSTGGFPTRSEERQPLSTVNSINVPADKNREEPKIVQKRKSTSPKPASNLPAYFSGVRRTSVEFSANPVFERENASAKLRGVRTGDLFSAIVEQSLKVSPTVPTPVRALATTGKLTGAYFLGEAVLDKELKRILISFTKLRTKDGQVYTLKAEALSPIGQIGLEGDFHSETGKFFVAELASAAATGLADSTIQRNQTAFGGWAQQPSAANFAKQAAVSALSKATERAAETARTAPEYTELKGFQEIQIILQDDPRETEG